MDKNKRRTAIQAIAALIQNANFKGFFTGKIYQGPVKNVCVPGLNCYSCPGAVAACPIGSLQNALSAYKFRFPYYVIGLMLFAGAILGRAICGFLCPFGFLQDLLDKVPFPRKVRTFRGDLLLRKLKYAILVVFVIVLPICVKLTPFFCKYICPSGTLAGLLLACGDTMLFQLFGSQFAWKACILALVILGSMILYRPFCKYFCPLGAIYGPLNQLSVYRMTVDQQKCVSCGKCAAACKMCVDPSKTPNHSECIRCGSCIGECPTGALYAGFRPDK